MLTLEESKIVAARGKIGKEFHATFNMTWTAAMVWCVGKGLPAGMEKDAWEPVLHSVFRTIAKKPWFHQETFLKLSDEMSHWMPIALQFSEEVPMFPSRRSSQPNEALVLTSWISSRKIFALAFT
jgi:hypothetical protein